MVIDLVTAEKRKAVRDPVGPRLKLKSNQLAAHTLVRAAPEKSE